MNDDKIKKHAQENMKIIRAKFYDNSRTQTNNTYIYTKPNKQMHITISKIINFYFFCFLL